MVTVRLTSEEASVLAESAYWSDYHLRGALTAQYMHIPGYREMNNRRLEVLRDARQKIRTAMKEMKGKA